MRNKYTLIIICLLLVSSAFAQDTIRIKNKRGAPKYRFKTGWVTEKTVLKIIEDNEEAVSLMKEARVNKVWGITLSYLGGSVVGYTIGYSLGSKTELNTPVLIMGVGIALVSIPFSTKYSKLARKSVKIYNDGITGKETSFIQRTQFGITPYGVGLTYNF